MSSLDEDPIVASPMVQRTVSASDAAPVQVATANSAFTWRGFGQPAGTESDGGGSEAAAAPTPAPAPAQPKSEAASPFLSHGYTPSPGRRETATDAAPPDQVRREKDQPMPSKPRNGGARSRKTRRGSPQLQICSALLQKDLTRDEIKAALPGLTGSQIYSALNNAKALRRVIGKDAGVFSLTDTGRGWVRAALGEDEAGEWEPEVAQTPPAPKKPARAPKRMAGNEYAEARTRLERAQADLAEQRLHGLLQPAVDTSPPPPPISPAQIGFRCALASDGSFWLTKGGAVINLTREEYAHMEDYQRLAHMLRRMPAAGGNDA